MRSAMNRFKLLSGGLAASLMVLVTASAIAQEAGQWTMTGRTPDLQRYSPLTAINKARSEEHTSELQSHHDLVCRLLLEKKKLKLIRPYHYSSVPTTPIAALLHFF